MSSDMHLDSATFRPGWNCIEVWEAPSSLDSRTLPIYLAPVFVWSLGKNQALKVLPVLAALGPDSRRVGILANGRKYVPPLLCKPQRRCASDAAGGASDHDSFSCGLRCFGLSVQDQAAGVMRS